MLEGALYEFPVLPEVIIEARAARTTFAPLENAHIHVRRSG